MAKLTLTPSTLQKIPSVTIKPTPHLAGKDPHLLTLRLPRGGGLLQPPVYFFSQKKKTDLRIKKVAWGNQFYILPARYGENRIKLFS